MRDLLNIIDSVLISEGVGLSNRKPGEKFKNSVGDLITFQQLEFIPDSGRFQTPEELQAALDEWLKRNNLTPDRVKWVNDATKGVGGFGIATFTSEDGTPYYLGRWFGNISPNRTQNNFPHDAIPGGFKYQSKSGQKENSGLKPSEWLTEFQNNTPETILQQCIAKFGEGSDEANALKIFIGSDIPCKVPRGNMNAEAFRDYFAEVLQPIALVMGKKVAGNAAEASKIFFGKPGYANCTISFNNNTIGGLYDSLLVNPEGKQIKLSSKGKDGASASVINLLKSVQELQDTPNGKKLLSKHREAIELLETIQKKGHFGAPLELGVKYGIITPEEAAQIPKLREYGPTDKIIGAGILSPHLEELYSRRVSKDPKRVIPLEHMTASVAYNVAKHVNDKTNFSEAASEILNNAALVQMYTDTSVSGDSITITKLTAVYPSQTVTGVLLDASKVYFSTGGKGNYTFSILKNGASVDDVNPADPVDTTGVGAGPANTSTQDLDQLSKQRSSVTAAEPVDQPLGTEKSLGRKRRV
jgi:hypothetical protein